MKHQLKRVRRPSTSIQRRLEQLENRLVLSAMNLVAHVDGPPVKADQPPLDSPDPVPYMSTVDAPENHEAPSHGGLEGVVELEIVDEDNDQFLCSGTLLPTGSHVLTAAHCVHGTKWIEIDGEQVSLPFIAQSGTTHFKLPGGPVSIPIDSMTVHPDWNHNLLNGSDIAVLKLEYNAPPEIERHGLYRGNDEVGRNGLKVGYGLVGTGANGWVENTGGTQRYGWNRFDAGGEVLEIDGGYPIATGTQLAIDFDNGAEPNDAMGSYADQPDLGLGEFEASPTKGDSGGPTFVNGLIAGVTSYGIGGAQGLSTDIDSATNASFGEIALDTRVAHFTDWIDQQTGIQIIDDGEFGAGYSETGTWHNSGLGGFQGDSRFSYGGTAQYQFTGLQPGWFEVSVKIPAHASSTENAVYHVSGIGNVSLDQRPGSNGWMALGIAKGYGNVTVTVSQVGSSALRTDGVRIAPIANFETISAFTYGYSETGNWFDSSLAGANGSTRYSLHGTAQYTFRDLDEGWYQVLVHTPSHAQSSDRAIYTLSDAEEHKLSVVSLDQRTVAEDWQELDVVPVGSDRALKVTMSQGGSGYLRADTIGVRRVPAPSQQTIDDGDVAGYSASGSWSISGLAGNEGDSRFSYGGAATYTFGDLAPGWYEVLTNTPGHSNSSDRAVYTIQPGSDPASTIVTTIDQRTGTNGWRSIETVKLLNGQMPQIQVTLSQGGSGPLRSDAVRVRPVAEPAYVTINDGSPGYSETSGWTASGLVGYRTNSRYTYNYSASANYTFNDMEPGWYKILINTPGASSSTDRAVYSIRTSASSPYHTVHVDQRTGTDGWRVLDTVELNDRTLEVILSQGGSGALRTDAIRVERMSSFFDRFASELAGYLANQQSSNWSGQSQSLQAGNSLDLGVPIARGSVAESSLPAAPDVVASESSSTDVSDAVLVAPPTSYDAVPKSWTFLWQDPEDHEEGLEELTDVTVQD